MGWREYKVRTEIYQFDNCLRTSKGLWTPDNICRISPYEEEK
jgi:hypothetical protein